MTRQRVGKDYSHKKREPFGSLFLCVVVMGGMDSPLRGSPFGRLRRLSHGVCRARVNHLRCFEITPSHGSKKRAPRWGTLFY